MNKLILNINDKPGGDNKKTAALPRRRPQKRGRRRLGDPQIRFWDLAQVNHQALDAEPFWEDHPILKSPTYTTEYTEWGSGITYFAGVRYLLETFENADFQAYTDMFFNYPVTEWEQRYRRIEGIPGYGDTRDSSDYRFDMRFSLDDSAASEQFMPGRLLSLSYLGQSQFNTDKETYLTNYHHFWHNDRNYAGYRDLERLKGQVGAETVGGYFPYDSNNSYFKLTATNDPNADAVSLGTPSGSYDVFLMPQVGFFMAVSHSSDWKTSEVAFAYQVMPRYLWPRYVEGLQINGAGQYGSESAVSSWLTYQLARSGMKYSSWSYTGTGSGFDYSYTEAEGVPGDWTGQSKWGAAVNGDDASPDGYYYSTFNRGSGIGTDNQPDYTTVFRADTSDANFGNDLIRCTDPFLTAVIKKGGQFYYVWDISHSVDGFGNFSCFETGDQHDRFRLSRNITWRSGYGNPPQPKDGTGFYYL